MNKVIAKYFFESSKKTEIPPAQARAGFPQRQNYHLAHEKSIDQMMPTTKPVDIMYK